VTEGIKLDRQMFLEIAISAFRKWLDHNASLRAAALAYFIILPLPLLLLIIVAILTEIYGQADAFQALIEQISTIAGPAVANLIQQLLETVTTPFTSLFASIITLVFTAIGTIGAYGVLQDTINAIWGVNQHKLNLFQRLKGKIFPFLLVSFLGLTIMIWTGITTFLLEFITLALVPLISSNFSVFLRIIQIVLSFFLATILFAVMYRQIPDLPIKWRDVILAATITGLLFTITNSLFGLVLEFISITSVTGAAGSVMILLLWIFLITQFIFYGAAFSKVYAEKVGSYYLNNRDYKQKMKLLSG
jgi:membrane protein